jgi:small-conductance mechanosensitive channel
MLGSVINQPLRAMNSIIYIVGLVVVIVAVLSFFGLR